MQARLQSQGIANPESQLTSDDKKIDAGMPGDKSKSVAFTTSPKVGDPFIHNGTTYTVLAGGQIKRTSDGKVFEYVNKKLVEVQ